MSFIGTLSQTLTLRAAFASSTYLLSQIPGPGRHLMMPCCSFWTMAGQRYCPRRIARLPRIIRLTQSSSTSHGSKGCARMSLTAATRLQLWGLAYLNPPPNPLFKGAIRAFGLSIASWLSLPANFGSASDNALFGTRGRRLRSRRAWSSRRLLVAGA